MRFVRHSPLPHHLPRINRHHPRHLLILCLLLASSLLLWRCVPRVDDIDTEPGDTLIVTLNTGAETLSLLNLTSGELQRDVAGTGRVPNDMLLLRDTLYVLNSDQQTVAVYRPEPVPVFLRQLDLADGGVLLGPYNFATDGDRLWISCFQQDQLLRLDPVSGERDFFPVGHTPQAVLCHEGLVVVSNCNYLADYSWGEGSLSVLEGDSDELLATVPVDINPQGLLLTPAGNLGILCTGAYDGTGVMLELDWLDFSVIQRRELNCDPLAATFQGDLLLLGGGGWSAEGELPGLVYLMEWPSGAWRFGPDTPLRAHRGAWGVLPLADGFLVACQGSGHVDRFDGAGTLTASWEAGAGVQVLLQLP